MKVARKFRLNGLLRVGLPIVILVTFGIYSALPHPTHNQTKLKAIATESRLLISAYPISSREKSTNIPKDKWPPTIAEMEPYSVTVFYKMVNITMKSSFDGGWGYEFARDRRDLGMLEKCWSDLGHDLFWHSPC